jgi:hypothetical protein
VITCDNFEYVKSKTWNCVNISTGKIVKPIWITNNTTTTMERGITYRNYELGSDIQNSFLLYKKRFFNTKCCIEFWVLIPSCLNVNYKKPNCVICVLKQKKQFCTYSENVLLSKVYGLKWQKYWKDNCNI